MKGRKRFRFVLLCHDPLALDDDDFVWATYSRRERAREEARRLNGKYMRLFKGWNPAVIPLFYVVYESVRVREKARVS